MLPPESAIPYQWHIPRENVLDTIVAVNSPWLLDVLKKKEPVSMATQHGA